MEGSNAKNVGKLFEKTEELHVAVARLDTTVKHGMDGIQKKQDKTNGNIEKLWMTAIELEKTGIALGAEVAVLKKKHLAEDDKKNWWRRQGWSTVLNGVSVLVLAYLLFKTGLG